MPPKRVGTGQARRCPASPEPILDFLADPHVPRRHSIPHPFRRLG